MMPRFQRVASITAPIGVCTASPSRPLTGRHQTDARLTPMLLRDEKHVQVGTERTPRTSASGKLIASSDRAVFMASNGRGANADGPLRCWTGDTLPHATTGRIPAFPSL